MIEFGELRAGDVVYTIYYEGGAHKVVGLSFISTTEPYGAEPTATFRRVDTGEVSPLHYASACYASKEEAERHAVLKALCDDSLVMVNLSRFSWFRNKIPAPSPPRVQAVDHARPKRLASRRYRLRRLLRRFWWQPRLPGSP